MSQNYIFPGICEPTLKSKSLQLQPRSWYDAACLFGPFPRSKKRKKGETLLLCITCQAANISRPQGVGGTSPNCLNSKPWFRLAFFQVSLNLSRPASHEAFTKSLYFRKHVSAYVVGILGTSPYSSSRHVGALRWLLILSGNVELNPGPITDKLSKTQLQQVLSLLKSDDSDFALCETDTKADLAAKINAEKPSFVKLAVQSVLNVPSSPKFDNTSTSDSKPQDANASTSTPTTIKLPEFFDADTRQWFQQVGELLAGQSEAVRKHSLLRAIPTKILRDSGANVTGTYEEIKNCLISHCDDTEDEKLRQALQQQSLGGERPSTVLRRLRNLAPGSDKLVRLRFLEMMPPRHVVSWHTSIPRTWIKLRRQLIK